MRHIKAPGLVRHQSAAMLLLTLKLSLLVFMAGSLFEMGLGLRLREALAGLADRRFVVAAVVAEFLAGPALALAMARGLPLAPAHGDGLILLGLAPCAPFVPALAARAGADMPYTAAMMMIAAVGTVLLMPVAVPLLVPGLDADAWTIARPLIVMVLAPLAAGMALFRWRPDAAAAIRPATKRVATAAGAVLLVLCGVMFGRGFIATFGSFAIGSQVAYLLAATLIAALLGRGLPDRRRSALALGMCTRNVGAALAPLLALSEPDEGAMVMVALGVPVQIICALPVASWFARRAAARGGVACRSG